VKNICLILFRRCFKSVNSHKVIWVGLLWSFLGLLVSKPSVAKGGIGLVLGVLVMVIAYDAGAYLVGSLVGRHRLAPEVSPGKSVEGAIGGTVLSLGLGIGVVGLFLHPWTVEAAGLVALVTVVLAPLGDLSESLVKREIGVKDTSGLLPGHGGLLDRIDGLLFVLPVAYMVTRVVLGH
jgi:phosphatidate cytidylyltransferase